MAAIVTSNMRISAATQFVDGFADSSLNTYLFIGRTLPWASGDNTPPTPVDCEMDESSAFLEMMSLKLVNSSGVSSVAPRYNWTPATVYTQYVNNIDLFDPTSGLPPFYVLTNQLNVYKCLNNNNGAQSTVQPVGTSTSAFTVSDGYQWKYMFTVGSTAVLNFVTPQWVPVSTLISNDGSTQWAVQQAAVPGTLDRIDLVAGGSQYSAIPTVVITGNGTGAAATATIGGGSVTGITVTNTGTGYTWATITFTGGGSGANGAIATATVSPFLGHGADPVRELGAFFVLVDTQLIYDENGIFTVSNDYRQIGLLQNPLLNDGSTLATGVAYDQSTRLTFTTVSGTVFNADEVVTGSISSATGVVLDYTTVGGNVLRLVEVVGTFIPGETVVGAAASGVLQTITGTAASGTTNTITLPSPASTVNGTYVKQTLRIVSGAGAGQIRLITAYTGSTRTALVSPAFTSAPNNTSVFVIASIISADLMPFSGNILYLETRRPIARSIEQIEDSKIVVQF